MESSNEESITDNDQTMDSSPVNHCVASPKESCECADHIFRESEYSAKLLAKIDKYQTELDECRKQKKALKDDITELREKLEICEERVKQHKMDAERAQLQVTQKDQMLAYSQERLNRKLAAMNCLTDQNKKLKQQIDYTNGTNNCARRSKSVVSDHRFMNDPRTKARPVSRNLEEELQSEKQNEENISQSDQTLKQVRKEFPQVLSERSNDSEASKNTENNLACTNLLLQAQVTAHENLAKKRENECTAIINNLKATIARIERELEDNKSKLQQSEADLAESRQKEQKSAEQRKEHKDIQAQIDANIKRLTAYISTKDKALNETTLKLSDANIKIEKQQAMETYLNNQLEERYKDLEKMKDQLESDQQKLEEREQKCTEYETALVNCKHDTETLEELNTILKRGNSELANKVATSDSKVSGLEQKLIENERKLAENEQKLAESEQKLDENEQKLAEYEPMKAKLEIEKYLAEKKSKKEKRRRKKAQEKNEELAEELRKEKATSVYSAKQIRRNDIATPVNGDLHLKLRLKEQAALELKGHIDDLTLKYNEKEAMLQKVVQKLTKCYVQLKDEKEFGKETCDKLGKCSADLQTLQRKCTAYEKKIRMLEAEKSQDSSDQHKTIASNGNMQDADDSDRQSGSSQHDAELQRNLETKIQQLQQTLAEYETKIAKLEDERKVDVERNAKQLEELRQSLDQSKKDTEKAIAEKNSYEEAVAEWCQSGPAFVLKRKRPLAEMEQESGSQDEMPKRFHTDEQNVEEINKEEENCTGKQRESVDCSMDCSTAACTSQTGKDPISALIPTAVCHSPSKSESKRNKMNRAFDSSPQSIGKLSAS